MIQMNLTWERKLAMHIKKYLILVAWLKTDFNSKVTKTTSSALTAVKNKIPDFISLIKKTDYNTKISQIECEINNHNNDKYITTPEFNTMVASVFNARLAAQTDLIKKRNLMLN